MTIGYAITLAFAVGLTVAYFAIVKKREFWLSLLYICVTVVNLGYLLLSASKTVGFAILANDVAYLGSVFLSLCMLLTIVKLCGFEVKKGHVIGCVTLGTVMFAIIATVGILPWYYKSVSLTFIDGSAKLVKEYGPLHNAYLVYLLGYFAAMIATIIHSIRRKKHGSYKFAGLMTAVVCGNILVWLIEKFINWEFEFLSVTYIISELVFLFLYWMMQDYVHVNDIPQYTPAQGERLGVEITAMSMEAKLGKVLSFVMEGEPLTIREREILELILGNKKRKEIADDLHLSENTVKTYTRTLYAKLNVTCREELFALLLQN
jgi:DNA-binding CsgD family transcriptional regulator